MQCINHQIVWDYAAPLAKTGDEILMKRLGMRNNGCRGREKLLSRVELHPLNTVIATPWEGVFVSGGKLVYSKLFKQEWNLTSAPRASISESESAS
jgi:hypothetical protein